MTWKSLRHPNLLTPLGVTTSDKHLGMVCEWMAKGNINEFIEVNRGANRFELVGVIPISHPRTARMLILSCSLKASPED